jgi:hypothetical protein
VWRQNRSASSEDSGRPYRADRKVSQGRQVERLAKADKPPNRLATDSAFSSKGTFHPLEPWDGEVIMKLFRQAFLERLVTKYAMSEEL